MADNINDFSEIRENFDTIKTLLNTIRAQGVLNTSDVDKLLAGIHAKLEKINTDEDVDLIKAFLSELKQNLDERHSVLVSKFGAIESLFSNLMKNSTEAVKTSELKELFDIVATNLSVFSREVVSQKETLSDITLRLDSIQSDDTQKKEIIKHIGSLKYDFEKLNNGFDSIVLSLNENFKTVLKTISEIDQSDAISGYGEQLTDLINSSNTILSAIQLIDKKNTNFEEAIEKLATQEDSSSIQKAILELSLKSRDINDLVDSLVEKSYKIDNLAEKIDASVNIIAGLKTEIADGSDDSKEAILERLNKLEEVVKEVSTVNEFEQVKIMLNAILDDIASGSKNISANYNRINEDIKEKLSSESDKLSQLLDANISRTINDITSNTESLNSAIKNSQLAMSDLCRSGFEELSENISGLKTVVAQLDENNISASNAIFSNITDRLAIFENSLKTSLEKQEDSVANSSSNVFEQIANIKNISEKIDYRLDASAIELSNTKREYESLKASVNEVLALDFATAIKEVKTDLFTFKQDLKDAVETSELNISEGITNDIFGKYELVVSKIDNIEDELKTAQTAALNNMKDTLDTISSQIVDVLSYVSVAKDIRETGLDTKFAEVTKIINDNNLNYVENVKDIIDVIRIQVEQNLRSIANDSEKNINHLSDVINESNKQIQTDIKNSYDKLLQVQTNFDEIKELLSANNTSVSNGVNDVLMSNDGIKNEFETKLNNLKIALLEKVTELKDAYAIDSNDKISELKFNSENLTLKTVKRTEELKNELRGEIDGIITSLNKVITDLGEQVSATSLKIEGSNREIVDFVKNDFTSEVNNSIDSIKTNTAEVLNEIDIKVNDVVGGFNSLDSSIQKLSKDTDTALTSTLTKILDNFVVIKSLINAIDEQSEENLRQSVAEIKRDFAELRKRFDEADSAIDEDLARQISIIEGSFESLNLMFADVMNQGAEAIAERIKKELGGAKEVLSEELATRLEHYKGQLEILFDELKERNSAQADYIESKVLGLNSILAENLNKQNNDAALRLDEISAQLKDILTDNLELSAADYNALKSKINDFTNDIIKTNDNLVASVRAQLDDIIKYFDSNFEIRADEVNEEFDKIISSMIKFDETVTAFNNEMEEKIQTLQSVIDTLKDSTAEKIDEKTEFVIDKLSGIIKDISESSLNDINPKINDIKEILFSQERLINERFTESDETSSNIQNMLAAHSDAINNNISLRANEIEDSQHNVIKEILSLQNAIEAHKANLSDLLNGEIKPEFHSLEEKLQVLFDNNSMSFIAELTNGNNRVLDDIRNSTDDFRAAFISLNERLDKDEISRMNIIQAQINELNNKFNDMIENSRNTAKAELDTMFSTLFKNSKDMLEEINLSVENKYDSILVANSDISAAEMQSIEAFTNNILENVESVKQNSNTCRDIIRKLIEEQVNIISGDIEKETDVIVADIIEQFRLLQEHQKDDLSSLTTAIESSVSGYVIDAVNDIKSYFDIKTDANIINEKIDNLKHGLENSVRETLSNINKLIDRSVFSEAISDIKAANEVLIGSMSDKINNELTNFIQQNVSKKFDDKFNLFDKKFTDTIVDKYEEVKLLSSNYNKSFEKIAISVQDIISQFKDTNKQLNEKLDNSLNKISGSVDELKQSFADLKAQIMNKSFDEAFHDAVHNQIHGLETLVNEQLSYIQDISDLCCDNLPEMAEMNTIVKFGILESVKDIQQKVNSHDNFDSLQSQISEDLNSLKTNIITQILDVFNQISFIAEQEEIIDFIQEKHAELITVLSHIVTSVDNVGTVKDNLAVVDNKIDSLKEDIDLINEKITSIMSAEGDIDYVYSLQDLESDIAALRVVLNDMKSDNKSKEFEELIGSTNNIYKLVETIKAEMPKFEADEFKKDFETLAEDIVSISTRTNKLILTSDESYKTLQDNLQDFKLVINDLDERTRNFPREAGIDKIDSKLASINTMIKNGAKTNQVFNQVFEYLAEWVDKAGAQITAISNKVDTLDEIGQIRVMLEDMRAQAEDNSESAELIDALTNVFDKQAKRIASMEAKIDRLIVENTINKKESKINMKPVEDTLNRFLAAIDDKMSFQQDKINLLEQKLEEVVSLVDNKDTAQLTKKVGGMDKQLAKLNKSIEKIASNVVEK